MCTGDPSQMIHRTSSNVADRVEQPVAYVHGLQQSYFGY